MSESDTEKRSAGLSSQENYLTKILMRDSGIKQGIGFLKFCMGDISDKDEREKLYAFLKFDEITKIVFEETVINKKKKSEVITEHGVTQGQITKLQKKAYNLLYQYARKVAATGKGHIV
jgi:hypothetical protein